MNITVFRILAALTPAELDAPAILTAIGRLDPGGRRPALTSFYRSLNAAVEAGWIEIVRADPDTETQTANEPSGRGRPKQAYRLTETGQHAT